jgi:serine protease Do
MKNLKFGVFCLGLIAAIATAVASLAAQPARVQVAPRGDRTVTILDGRGSQLGVMVSDLDTKEAGTTGGVKIDEVNQDSPAEKAGLKAGDVVVEYDGERVRSARQFTRLVQETADGRSVRIAVLRDGKRQTVDATPESRMGMWNGFNVDQWRDGVERGMREFRFEVPREFEKLPREFEWAPREYANPDNLPRGYSYRIPDMLLPYMNGTRGRLGVTVQSMTRDLEEYFGAKNGGALVSSVTPDSPAAKAGIKAGDVIVTVNGRGVQDSNDLIRELEDATGEVTIVLMRDKKEMTLKATLERPRPATPRAGSRPGV